MTRIDAIRAPRRAAVLLMGMAVFGSACPVQADEPPVLGVSRAWTPVQATVGVDTPLFMTVTNHAGAADALVRVRCPVSTFTELRVLDRGEGVPAPRLVKTIPIPANDALKLDPDGPRIMLLQTTEALAAGAGFSCQLTFRNAGAIEVAVQVGEPRAEASR